jgi:hypothetical protein
VILARSPAFDDLLKMTCPFRLLPLAALLACGANPPTADRPAPDPPAAPVVHAAATGHVADASDETPVPDSADYAVYSEVLRSLAQSDESYFIVMDSTAALQVDDVARSLLEEAFKDDAEAVSGLFGQLFWLSERRHPLQPALSLERDRYRMMSDAEFRGFFGLGPSGPFHPHSVDGWTALAERYPGASGQHTFSRVAYDREGRTALVFYRQRCGNACARTHYVVLLRREDASWKVGETVSVFSYGDDHTYSTHDSHGTTGDTMVVVGADPPPPVQAPMPVVPPPG